MLITPCSPSFARCTDIFTGTPQAANAGVNFTFGASSADGASVSVLAAVPHDIHYLVIGIAGGNLSGADAQCLFDILVDPAGGSSWSELIDSLIGGFTPLPAAGGGWTPSFYHFPLWIKSGSSLGVRGRTKHTAAITTGRIIIWAYGEPNRPEMWWCGSKVESLGINAGTSSGTNVTPGNSGTFGSWADIGGTTSGRFGAIQLGINGSDAAATAVGYHWQIGHGSLKMLGSPTIYSSNGTSETGQRIYSGPIYCDIPAATQMQVRGTCSGTAEVHNVALYGVR